MPQHEVSSCASAHSLMDSGLTNVTVAQLPAIARAFGITTCLSAQRHGNISFALFQEHKAHFETVPQGEGFCRLS